MYELIKHTVWSDKWQMSFNVEQRKVMNTCDNDQTLNT